MSFLWKKRGTESSPRDGIEKMDAFRRTFQNQLGSDCPPYNCSRSMAGKVDKKKQKRFRSAFTTTQIALLEKEFKKDPYVTNVRREQVANSLNLPERAVKIWFQNRRMKEKRDSCKGYDTEDLESKNHAKSPDDLPNNVNPTNQQHTPMSLAAKIVFSDDAVEVTKNDNYQPTQINVKPKHAENQAEKLRQYIPEVKVENERGTPTSTKTETIMKAPLEKLGNYGTSTKTNGIFSVEKATPLKQAVGHVLPFSQISNEHQKTQQNLKTSTTMRTDQAQQNAPSETKMSDLIPPYSSIPVDLSKYYSSMSPVPHLPWNRINFVPVMPGTQGLPYFDGSQGVPTAPTQTRPVQNCSCDCHLSSLEAMRAQHPMFFTPYVPHFITPVPTPHPTTKY